MEKEIRSHQLETMKREYSTAALVCAALLLVWILGFKKPAIHTIISGIFCLHFIFVTWMIVREIREGQE